MANVGAGYGQRGSWPWATTYCRLLRETLINYWSRPTTMGALDIGNTTEVAEIPEQKQGLAVARWATTSVLVLRSCTKSHLHQVSSLSTQDFPALML
jgi:hypothetical protein